ncbi:MAG TPA: 4-hydroxy-tetrahydrodipicolinate synthase [Longimicrobiales bacterium]|nr:4-hydroxy-tetrahydrodipicolinate synthase [Longimicrobiales bacterium]
MPDPRFEGSGVALVTPFDADGVNTEVLEEMVEWHISEGTDALIVCGSTGEAAAMSVPEQGIAVRAVVSAAGGKVPVIAGCGGSDTAVVRALARHAADLGADAVLLSAPPYNRPPRAGLIAHFRAVMDAADLPAILYNVPGRAAVNVPPDVVEELATDSRVIGVKEASGDLSQIAELARRVGDRLVLWSGNDDQILPILSLGGRGVISVLGNVAPGATHKMVRAYLDGDHAAALDIQLHFLPLIAALFAESNPIPVKSAVRWLGFDVGEVRLPLVAPAERTRERLIDALAESGLRPLT